MPIPRPEERAHIDTAGLIENEIKSFALNSPLNHLPAPNNNIIFDEPLVQFADGDDPIFTEYKNIIHSTHFTPREALARAYNKNPEDLPSRLSVISWILPITSRTRESNRRRKKTPSRDWVYTRWYGEKVNDATREHMVNFLTKREFLVVAPLLQPYFKISEPSEDNNYYSNWSERHIAYAAGLGTFSLSDGFITERGIAHRCGSIVTNLELPASPRTAKNPYANCLYYINGKCQACINRCPAGAITDKGHDKIKCGEYFSTKLRRLNERYGVRRWGCGLCQTKVPCESINPVRKLK